MALDRRVFIKFTAGGVVGTLFTPLPWKLADDVSIWTQNWPWIPKLEYGEKGQHPALAKLGNDQYGILVNTIAGRPVTVTGNPAHPLSRGGIDPVAAASVQLLYSPARIKTPLLKQNGTFRSISWKEGKELLLNRLRSCQRQADQVMAISGDQNSSVNEVLSALLNRLDSKLFFHMPADNLTMDRTWQEEMNGQGMVDFDLDGADLVLCTGADLLDNFGSPVRNQKMFADRKFTLIYAGPVQNQTAAVANTWIPVKPENMADFLFSLACQLIAITPASNISGLEGLRNYLQARYTAKQAEQKTGIAANRYKFLARMLLAAQRPLVIAGSPAGMGAEPALLYAALVVNVLLGRVNRKGGLRCIPEPPRVLSASNSPLENRSNDLLKYMKSTQPRAKLLLLYECNPFYALPETKEISKALGQIDYKVSFSTFMDESAAQADLILPTPHFLERYDDSFTPFGSGQARYSIAKPVINPLTNVRSAPDLILALLDKLGPAPEVTTYTDLLKNKAGLLNAPFEKLCAGQVWSDDMILEQNSPSLWNAKIEELLRSRKSPQDRGLTLTLIQKAKTGFPRVAVTPFGVKTIFADDLNNNLSVARLNAQTARGKGLKDGDRVKISSRNGEIMARIKVDEGVMDNCLALTLGLGHTAWDEFSKGKGENALQLAEAISQGRDFFSWDATTVDIKKV